MPSLAQVADRFTVDLTVIEGGAGKFPGVVTEPNQGEIPSYIFDFPRRLLRVAPGLPVKAGMIIKDIAGQVFLTAEHGVGQSADEVNFRNFRLIQMTGQFELFRQEKIIDPLTRLPKSNGETSQGFIWGVYEPASREQFDRKIRVDFEEGRFVTNADLQLGDRVNDMTVERVDKQLGVTVASLG